MQFRLLQLSDFPEVYEMWHHAGLYCESKEHEKETYDNLISRNPDTCIAAMRDNNIIGTLLAGYDGYAASVYRVAVHNDYKQQGIGSAMFKEIEGIVQQKGITKLFLKVHVENSKVINFYNNIGFKEVDYARSFYKELI